MAPLRLRRTLEEAMRDAIYARAQTAKHRDTTLVVDLSRERHARLHGFTPAREQGLVWKRSSLRRTRALRTPRDGVLGGLQGGTRSRDILGSVDHEHEETRVVLLVLLRRAQMMTF
jgi:hypothetical protein